MVGPVAIESTKSVNYELTAIPPSFGPIHLNFKSNPNELFLQTLDKVSHPIQ
jgi:hypothetical protein